MDHGMPRTLTRVVRGFLATALVALALAGCGGGDDDEDGTATSAVESTAATVEESPTPVVLTESSPTEGERQGTEVAASPGAATPTPAIVVSAPPVIIPTPSPSEATPVAPDPPNAPATPIVATASILMGDGTGGPMADGASPAGTPLAGGTPVAGSVTVDSCEVAELPEYLGSDPQQVTIDAVNFRSGPGTDCPVIGEVIDAGVTVEVLSNPVEREGEDIVWVAVNVDGEEGWLATEFLEPAN